MKSTITDEQREQAIALLRQSYGISIVARQVGCPLPVVTRLRDELGLPKAKAGGCTVEELRRRASL
jgi:transposase-like protein